MRAVLFAVVAVAGCGPVGEAKKPTAPAPEEPKPRPAPKKEPPPGPGGNARNPEPDPEPAPKPEPAKPLTFDEALATAKKMGEALDREEPEATKQAFALLTGEEVLDAKTMMRFTDDLPEFAPKLVRLGFKAWAARENRKVAAADLNFPAVARALWDPAKGAQGVLGMMNSWGSIDPGTRQLVYTHVVRSTPTAGLEEETRDAILNLGGEKWLRR